MINIPQTFLPTAWQIALGCTPAACEFPPGALLSILLPNILILAGIIFFGLIVAGGWSYIIGAGGEPSAQDKAKAKAALTSGIIGFLLVISAYFILQIVETVTGVKFLQPNI